MNKRPFIVKGLNGIGKIQFSDVGIGYHFKETFERPEVVINKKLAYEIG